MQHISLHILEHQVHSAFTAESLLELDDVGTAKPPKHPDLSLYALQNDLVILQIFEFLDGHYVPSKIGTQLSGLPVSCLEYNAVGSLIDHFQHLVLVHIEGRCYTVYSESITIHRSLRVTPTGES